MAYQSLTLYHHIAFSKSFTDMIDTRHAKIKNYKNW